MMLVRLISEDVEIVTVKEERLWNIKAGRSQMEQVLMNLAVNARDSMPMGGKLTIKTANVALDEEYAKSHVFAKPGEYVLLTVSDTGCGIPEGIKEQIFEPFFSTKGPGKGTGLGLATVYGIVKQNNGFISFHSEPGRGSTFNIYLPRLLNTERAVEDEKRPRPMWRGTETILLVEDDKDVRELAGTVLSKLGYTLIKAGGGDEAISACENCRVKPHLLLTDVIMPKMNGGELAEKIRKTCPSIRVLYMSGYTDEVIDRHGVFETCVNFISKPIKPKDLAQAVRKTLDSE